MQRFPYITNFAPGAIKAAYALSLALAQRAAMAAFAIAFRRAGLSFSARALPPTSPPARWNSSRSSAVIARYRAGPPFLPPSFPNATAAGFFFFAMRLIIIDNSDPVKYTRDMRAIGYVRVSTEKQAEHGVSLEAQTEKIRAMAVVQGAELTDIVVDAGESAKSLDRPGMERILALIDARAVDVVIIAKLDRLTRSVKDLAELLERFNRRGVSLVSVAESLDTGSAAGRLVLNIMTAVSQWEREAIGERTRDAMRHKKANGQRVGTVPFGFRLAVDGRMLVEDAAEQDILARIRELKAAGNTTRQIADELNRQGYRTRRGTAWRFEYVAAALRTAA